MNVAACQICGRPKHVCVDGTIAKHYANSEVCAGSHELPFRDSCMAIEAAIGKHHDADRRCVEIYLRHRDERRNAPLSPEFWRIWHYAVSRKHTLERRLKRWHREHPQRLAA